MAASRRVCPIRQAGPALGGLPGAGPRCSSICSAYSACAPLARGPRGSLAAGVSGPVAGHGQASTGAGSPAPQLSPPLLPFSISSRTRGPPRSPPFCRSRRTHGRSARWSSRRSAARLANGHLAFLTLGHCLSPSTSPGRFRWRASDPAAAATSRHHYRGAGISGCCSSACLPSRSTPDTPSACASAWQPSWPSCCLQMLPHLWLTDAHLAFGLSHRRFLLGGPQPGVRALGSAAPPPACLSDQPADAAAPRAANLAALCPISP